MSAYSGDFDGDSADGEPGESNAERNSYQCMSMTECAECYSQDGDEDGVPELLGADNSSTSAGEVAVGGLILLQADEDPDKDDRSPSSETMVTFEEAVNDKCVSQLSNSILKQVRTCGGEHGSRESQQSWSRR